MKLENMFNGLIALIYPKKCVCCKELINEEDDLCDACKNEIERNGDKICTWCGQQQKYCECKFRVYRFRGIVAPFLNEGLAQQGLYDIKFHNRSSNAVFFAKEMAKVVNKHFENIKFDVICPVPMSYLKKAERGYNQSEILAKELSRILGIKTDTSVLFSHRKKKIQHEIKSVTERYSNIKGRYYCKKKINFKNVLLVDDVKTTGATIDECSRQLMLAGAENVYCVTALITNPWLKKAKKKDIIKNKSGDKNGNRNRN